VTKKSAESAEPAELQGTIDLHVHAAPDVRPRKATMLEVARAAAGTGMRAVVFKSHHEQTASLAALANEAVGRRIAYGGLVLNRYVGGLNPDAVQAGAALGARIVWMPTFTARHHLTVHGEPAARGLTVLLEDGRLSPPAQEVLDAIAGHGLALGTGHLSPSEVAILAPEARRRGIRAVVVTHPESGFIAMPLDLQQGLARIGGVYFERCRNSSPGRAGEPTAPDIVDRIAFNIRQVGVATTVLSTDFGQPDNPFPVDGLCQYHRELRARGFTESELQRMARQNPAQVLGL
jgi:hypothetical protein